MFYYVISVCLRKLNNIPLKSESRLFLGSYILQKSETRYDKSLDCCETTIFCGGWDVVVVTFIFLTR